MPLNGNRSLLRRGGLLTYFSVLLFFFDVSTPSLAFQSAPTKAGRGCHSEADRAKLAQFGSHGPRLLVRTVLSSDGRVLVVSVRDSIWNRLIAYDTASGHPLWDHSLESPATSLAVDSNAAQVAGGFLVPDCGKPFLRRWNLRTGEELPALEDEGNLSSILSDPVLAVEYSPDGSRLLAALGGDIRVWNTGTGRNIFQIQAPGFDRPEGSEKLADLTTDADNKKIAAASERSALLWDVASKKLLGRFGQFDQGSVEAVLLSPDSKLLAVQARSVSKVYDTTTNKLVKSFDSNFVPISFGPGGALVLAGPQGVLDWSPQGGKLSAPLPGKASSLFFLKDGRILGTVGLEKDWEGPSTQANILTLIDLTTGKQIQRLVIPGRSSSR